MREGSYPTDGARKLVRTATPGIFRRDNRYVVVVRHNGRQVKRFARTLAEARTIRATLTADVARGEFRAASKLTLAEYAATWLDTYTGRTSRGLRPQTLAAYRGSIERDVLPVLGGLRLAEVEAQHLKQLAASLSARGLGRNSIRLALAPLKALLATAHEEGVIRSNPAAGLRLTSPQPEHDADERKAKALTEEELARLLGELPPQWRLVFEFMAHTGLRIGEVIGLQWQHVDFGRRRVFVRRRWYRGTYAPPKSRYGRRDVPLSQGMARQLWALRKASRGADDALVFGSANGTPLNTANVYNRVYKPAAKRAGVSWATFHTLRHTCATTLFRRGLNAKQVQAWLGHHAASFTLDTYIHLLDDDLPDADFLDEIVPSLDVTTANEETRDSGSRRLAEASLD